jgi:hypothetical protein
METAMGTKLLAAIPIAAAFAAFIAASMPSPSEAGLRRLRSAYTPGEVITAYSRFGNGSISSVVRPGRTGWEVKLPGGAWTGCRRSCEETLRVQTVDIFGDDNSLSSGGYGTLQRECGIFGCLGGYYEFSF